MPQHLQELVKRRKFNKISQIQAFCQERGFTASANWYISNKEQWQPKIVKGYDFEDGDTSLDNDLASRVLMYKKDTIKVFSEEKHFTGEQIERFIQRTPEACAEFAKECLVWYAKPIILQDYQLKMIDGWLNKPRTCYPMGRGAGKDFTLAIFLSWYLTCFPNTRAMLVCPAQRQVKTFVAENIAVLMQTSSAMYESIDRIIEEEFKLHNGSILFTYGATSFIKGKHNINFIFVNEGAEVQEHVYENVLMPMLGIGSTQERGHFGIMGVPGGQDGFMWKAYNRGTQELKDESEFFVINLPTSVNRYYSKEQLHINQTTMSHDAYLQEHEAIFLDLKDALFTSKVLEKMVQDYDTQLFKDIDHKQFLYYLGIDWGRKHDYSVMIIVAKHKKTGECRIVYLHESHKPFKQQLDLIVGWDALYNFKKVIPEWMGIGIAPSEDLRDRLGSGKVKYFIPTPASWFDVFTRLHDLADKDKFTIPASELKLIRQLRLLQFQVRNNKLTVRSEGKDDHAQALGIIMHGIRGGGGVGVAGSL
jgi:hypothetical protein